MKLNDSIPQNQEPTKKELIDPSFPVEELLGSVTTYNTIDGSDVKSLQVRSSARVLKKVKDLAAQPLTIEKKVEPIEKKEETKPEVKKPAPRADWTLEEKNLFFEALNEYGKDFEAIQLYVNNKLKKKCLPEYAMKNRQQVRHLYFRFWHKISKHLVFSDELKKIVQELYGLINFGELRKKIPITDKTCRKLNELIYRGFTLLRVKGKTIRVRTPNCRALRRLNQLDESGDDIKLPTRVLVELRPKNMETWVKVQELSQNPRVKTLMPLQKRLSSLLTFMAERWKTSEAAEYEKLVNSSKLLLDQSLDSDLKTKAVCDPALRFCPLPDATITIPVISITEYFNTHSICLTSYEERNGVKTPGKEWLEANPKFRNLFKGTPKRGVKRVRAESLSDKVNHLPKPQCSSTDNNENCVLDSDCSENKFDDIFEDAVNRIMALKNQVEQAEEREKEIAVEKVKEDIKKDDDCLINIKKEHEIAKIRCGWVMSESGTLAIGDLYLMFGSNAKVTLEYSWDEPKDADLKTEEEVLDNMISNGMDVEENEVANQNSFTNNYTNLSVTLKRLVSVAKLHYRKNIVKCSCGHVCAEDTMRNKTNPNITKSDGLPQMENKNNITTTGSMVPVRIQPPPFKRICPTNAFRRPISPNEGFKAQMDSIQRIIPRYCNRKGRPRTKHMIVERKLPLLPNEEDSGRKIVHMNISQAQEIPSRHIAPKPQVEVKSNMTTCGIGSHINNGTYLQSTHTPSNISSNETMATFTLIPINENRTMPQESTPSRADSPTGISQFLDMAFKSHEEQQNGCSVNAKEMKNAPSFTGFLHNHTLSSPPTSPSRILKENENQWLNSEVADFSLSSLLGHLETPVKNLQSMVTNNDDSRLSLPQDVEAQLQSLMTETSLDYTAKFADLAAEVTNTKK